MVQKKRFKYFAFRTGSTVIIKRTVSKLTLVKSVLRKPSTDLALVQIFVTGGQDVGTIAYVELAKRTQVRLKELQCIQISRETVKGLKPFLLPGELSDE